MEVEGFLTNDVRKKKEYVGNLIKLLNFSSASLVSLNLSRNNSKINVLEDGFDHENSRENESPANCKSICSQFMGQTLRRKNLEKKLPITKWIRGYDVNKLVADIIAGLTVGLTILPQGLAYAIVAGLPPQYGLYSGFVGCFCYFFFGSEPSITIGPTAILAIITHTYTFNRPPAYAVILCFLTGIVTMLMGLLQLGFIVNFISIPVNSGFTSAAALTICSTQIKGLFGLKFAAEGFLGTLEGVFVRLADVNLYDAAMSMVCITLLLILQKLQLLASCLSCSQNPIVSKILWFISTSRNAFIVIGGTLFVANFGAEKITIVGHIVPGLPDFKPPPFTIVDPANNVTHSFSSVLYEESSAIIVIPLLAIMEHITIAKAFAGSRRIDANQEMISIGISNIIGSFFSSMPIAGSFSRTTVNQMSGARSPLGGIITGTMVILALRFLTPYFYFIPKAALSSVIVCAVIFMVDLEIIKPMWQSKKLELVPWGMTFLVSLLIGLEFGMMTGFLISVIFLMYYAARPGVKVKKGSTTHGNVFILVELDRSLTFPSVDYIRYVVSKSASSFAKNVLPIVVDASHIHYADYTAAQGIKDLTEQFRKADHIFTLYKVKPSLIKLLSGVMDHFPHCEDENGLEEFIDCNSSQINNKMKTIAASSNSTNYDNPALKLDDTDDDVDRKRFSSIPLS